MAISPETIEISELTTGRGPKVRLQTMGLTPQPRVLHHSHI